MVEEEEVREEEQDDGICGFVSVSAGIFSLHYARAAHALAVSRDSHPWSLRMIFKRCKHEAAKPVVL